MTNFSWISGVVGLSMLVGCGGAVYRPSEHAKFEIDATREVTDEDVEKAFEARPQLPESFKVAYYSFDTERTEDIEKMLTGVAGVVSVYRIPPLMTSGKRRNHRANRWAPPEEVSVKKLRLLAARARADVLVVVDAGYEQGEVNGLVALNALVVPIFFTPWLDRTAESYLEAYVIDTRNGYLYGHVVTEEEGGDAFSTIYADPDEVVEAHWAKMRADMGVTLSALFAAEMDATRAIEPTKDVELAEAKVDEPKVSEPKASEPKASEPKVDDASVE